MGELDYPLADVLALQQADKGFGRMLQSEDNVFANLDLALINPLTQRTGEFAVTWVVVDTPAGRELKAMRRLTVRLWGIAGFSLSDGRPTQGLSV